MHPARRVGVFAGASLVIALALAVAGLALRSSGVSPFWGGFLFALGDAALVGGLADWFAVRALFAHPLGFRFVLLPHTAIIPRNRKRIVQEIRSLVENDWLPKDNLVRKVQGLDFVAVAIRHFPSLRPRVLEIARSVAVEILLALDPAKLGAFLARSASQAIDPAKVAPFLVRVLSRTREERWLDALVGQWRDRLSQWVKSPQCHEFLRASIVDVVRSYKQLGLVETYFAWLAESTGALNLGQLATLLQQELQRAVDSQFARGSDLIGVLYASLERQERRLQEDPQSSSILTEFLVKATDADSLEAILIPLVTALRTDAVGELQEATSSSLNWLLEYVDQGLERLAQDPSAKERANQWCSQITVALIDRHHGLIGALVEEQMDRLSDDKLVELVQSKVGEDLNWIRINGAVVGGMVGASVYLFLFATGF